jgi:ABC-type transporter Mla maintaining outer membrane lipid asymmetry ATPase subunit MlaF
LRAGFRTVPTIRLHNPASGRSCEVELGRGLTYLIEADTAEGVDALLEQLLRYTDAQVADSVGGTISSINVLENIGLPVVYHGLASVARLEQAILDLFSACGVDEARAEALCRMRPGELGPFEKRLVGFMRGVLMHPDVLVYRRFFEGLTRGEMQRAAALNAVYRARQPAGTAIHLLLSDMPVQQPECDRRFVV